MQNLKNDPCLVSIFKNSFHFELMLILCTEYAMARTMPDIQYSKLSSRYMSANTLLPIYNGSYTNLNMPQCIYSGRYISRYMIWQTKGNVSTSSKYWDSFLFRVGTKLEPLQQVLPHQTSAKNISVCTDWLPQSGCALSEPSETPQGRIHPPLLSIPRVELHIALRSRFRHFFSLCRSPAFNKHSGVVANCDHPSEWVHCVHACIEIAMDKYPRNCADPRNLAKSK